MILTARGHPSDGPGAFSTTMGVVAPPLNVNVHPPLTMKSPLPSWPTSPGWRALRLERQLASFAMGLMAAVVKQEMRRHRRQNSSGRSDVFICDFEENESALHKRTGRHTASRE